mmetsp:Transcript_46384/g.123222  ORF Transcript_46384/g.123222 Transcript_46384/m.123222 type:complete len:202 (-) Transcript_46384:2415-3020(-)
MEEHRMHWWCKAMVYSGVQVDHETELLVSWSHLSQLRTLQPIAWLTIDLNSLVANVEHCARAPLIVGTGPEEYLLSLLVTVPNTLSLHHTLEFFERDSFVTVSIHHVDQLFWLVAEHACHIGTFDQDLDLFSGEIAHVVRVNLVENPHEQSVLLGLLGRDQLPHELLIRQLPVGVSNKTGDELFNLTAGHLVVEGLPHAIS